MVNDSTALVAVMDATEARAKTDRVKVAVGTTWEWVKELYVERAWVSLGYSSWDDYCTREFGDLRLRLPREDREDVVTSLRSAGLSLRAIAAATGDSKNTVARALQPPVPNGTPDDEPPTCDGCGNYEADCVCEDVMLQAPEPKTTKVIGKDGKTYKQPTASKTKKRTDITRVVAVALSQVDAAVRSLADLNRGQLTPYASEVPVWSGNLAESMKALEAFDQLLKEISE